MKTTTSSNSTLVSYCLLTLSGRCVRDNVQTSSQDDPLGFFSVMRLASLKNLEFKINPEESHPCSLYTN
jgi:hypothetical protein